MEAQLTVEEGGSAVGDTFVLHEGQTRTVGRGPDAGLVGAGGLYGRLAREQEEAAERHDGQRDGEPS